MAKSASKTKKASVANKPSAAARGKSAPVAKAAKSVAKGAGKVSKAAPVKAAKAAAKPVAKSVAKSAAKSVTRAAAKPVAKAGKGAVKAPAKKQVVAKAAPAKKPAASKPVASKLVSAKAKASKSVVSKTPAPKPTIAKGSKAVAGKRVTKAAAKPVKARAAIDGKWVYSFGDGKAEGAAEMRDLLGGKGANLAEMANLGLPVPPGFTIPTSVCTYFYANDKTYPKDLKPQVDKALAAIGKATGKGFGDAENPLLVSVRSGGRASMPGMMDTVLNLGLNDETVEALARLSGDRRFAYDSYRRFITMYSDVVLGFEHHHFEDILDTYKDSKGYALDTDLDGDDWTILVGRYKDAVAEETGKDFPQDPHEQLWGAVGAVFSSWMNARAVTYRRLHDIPESWGTAVNIQAMVFGNMGETSATGVAFTRNPSTGERRLYGEFLINAQGEDVVAGIRTPQDITDIAREESGSDKPSMETAMPEAYNELTRIYTLLEAHYRDMQDMEFTVEQGRLWMLQTRNGKRTAKAALRIAVELASEGVISKDDAILRIDPATLDQLLHPNIDPSAKRDIIATGLPASPGAASGEIVFSSEEAAKLQADGHRVILVRIETSPEDIHGMHAAEGILTTRGGMTSHAAVVARGMGKPCVSGCGSIRVDYGRGTMTVGERQFKAGDVITIDGSTGEVLVGRMPMIEPELSGEFGTLMGWADDVRRLKVRVNGDTPEDARTAIKFGAEGIGLCRTEHMFFEETRIRTVREMILADDEQSRRVALAKLLPMQRADFVELFEIMKGLPVTVRLLDPPLHEFLPHSHAEVEEVARAMNTDPRRLADRARDLAEFNPMLGFRGCRLAIAYPEIAEMQARALFEAAVEAAKRTGELVGLEVMVPLIASKAEFDLVKARIDATAQAVIRETGAELNYSVGTMIELPRACLMAGEVAQTAAFFSFGTNDLTQTVFGISRDDAASFLGTYIAKGIFSVDPFISVDRAGVGELVKIGVERGRNTNKSLKVGICGEHGGDPASVAFCHEIGLDYVSCSPYRVPIARLAAAQAALGKIIASEG